MLCYYEGAQVQVIGLTVKLLLRLFRFIECWQNDFRKVRDLADYTTLKGAIPYFEKRWQII